MDAKREALQTLAAIPEMAGVLDRVDHVDVVTVQGAVSLRAFVAGLLGRRPAWLRFLYRLRAGLAFLLGLRQEAASDPQDIQPEAVPMVSGDSLNFFTVVAAGENRHWVAVAAERHLRAWIGVLVTPLPAGRKKFVVVTVVRYLHWTGPVYFNLIRPFHALVVWRMARSAARLHHQRP